MTTTQQPALARDATTVFLPTSPTIGFDHLRRDIAAGFGTLHARVDAEWETELAALDTELGALGIKVADPAPAARPKRRWRR
jgi:hypothetical protein